MILVGLCMTGCLSKISLSLHKFSYNKMNKINGTLLIFEQIYFDTNRLSTRCRGLKLLHGEHVFFKLQSHCWQTKLESALSEKVELWTTAIKLTWFTFQSEKELMLQSCIRSHHISYPICCRRIFVVIQ